MVVKNNFAKLSNYSVTVIRYKNELMNDKLLLLLAKTQNDPCIKHVCDIGWLQKLTLQGCVSHASMAKARTLQPSLCYLLDSCIFILHLGIQRCVNDCVFVVILYLTLCNTRVTSYFKKSYFTHYICLFKKKKKRWSYKKKQKTIDINTKYDQKKYSKGDKSR